MFEKKLINLGVEDFKKVIEDSYFYIDKTKFIEDLYKDRAEVSLFTRPRRFGKTLNMSMLKYFFDTKNKEENKKLFENLYIGNSPLMQEQGKYPVIFLSLKDLKEDTWDKTKVEIIKLIVKLFRDKLFALDILDEFTQVDYKNLCKMDSAEPLLNTSLQFLSEVLEKYYGEKVILIVDEYDSPLINAYKFGYYDQAVNFFRSFYSNVLKTNTSLERAFLTGITRIANEDIFSGLNNHILYSILDEKFADSFGLTEEDVENSLKYFDDSQDMELIKKWYNGYKFGNVEIYNPWSITNYLTNKKIESYWINTSGNYLILEHLSKIDEEMFETLVDLFKGNCVEKSIDKHFTVRNMINKQHLWELMLFGGYLTVDKQISRKSYLLRIPNLEIREYFKDKFLENNFGTNNDFEKIIEAFLKCKFYEFEEHLKVILKEELSFHDTAKDEKYYHLFVLGLISCVRDNYIIKSNIESGYGRCDLALIPKNNKEQGFIIEFKVAKTENEMKTKLAEAMNQINKNEYISLLEEHEIKNIDVVGMVFYGKQVILDHKKI